MSDLDARDQFALAAMAALISHRPKLVHDESGPRDADATDIARWAYEYAEAMMKEREEIFLRELTKGAV